jgi:hypothetical protein
MISFAITGAGVRTIAPSTPLPAITDPVTLDGTTENGFAGVPVIELTGVNAGAGANGLVLSSHTKSVIRGLTIDAFQGAGILITGGGSHTVVGNYIGTNTTGTSAHSNETGVLITSASSGNTIGGTTAVDRNIISGNTAAGVQLDGVASQNVITGNFIGTTVNGGTALPNGTDGVALTGGAISNLIGGFDVGAGNVIAGNDGAGISLGGTTTANNTIAGNRIGRGFSGLDVPNKGAGIRFDADAGSGGSGGSNANVVTLNTIAGNTGAGVSVATGARFVAIKGNSITANGGLGIDMAANANGDQPVPVLSSVALDVGGIKVSGTFSGAASTSYTIELFGNSAADASGFGEGATPLGTVPVTTNAAGAGSFALTVNSSQAGAFVTGTATADGTNETSSFSNALSTVPPPPPFAGIQRFAAGAGSNVVPDASAILANGNSAGLFPAFAQTFTGGVRVAMADFNGDGTLDVVVGTGPGIITRVRVLDGITGAELFSIQPFEASFTGGVYVAAGDLNGDGKPELVISPDEGGGPRVRIFDGGKSFVQVNDFFGISDPNFRGGARTAVGDFNNDGRGDLAVAAGFGGGPRVALFDGNTIAAQTPVKLIGDFFAFEQSLRNGIFLAAGDVNGDGYADLVTGGGPGGGPRVQILSGIKLTQFQTLVPIANFFAGDVNNRGGIRVAVRDLDADSKVELITGGGEGTTGVVNVYNATQLNTQTNPLPFLTQTPFGGSNGVYVG